MYLKSTFIDYKLSRELMILGIKEGVIDDYKEFIFSKEELEYQKSRISHKSRILRLLTLFDTIEMFNCPQDLSFFVEHGIILKNPNKQVLNSPYSEYGDDTYVYDFENRNLYYSLFPKNKELFFYCHKIAITLLSSSIQKIKYEMASKFHIFYDSTLRFDTKEKIQLLNKCIPLIVKSLYGYGFYSNKSTDPSIRYDKYQIYYKVGNALMDIYQSYFMGVYYATEHNYVLSYSSKFKGKPSQKIIDDSTIIENAYYFIKFGLSDVIKYLPNPKNLDDVLRLREDKRIIKFREVFSKWIEILKNNPTAFEMEVRKEVMSANNELRKVENISKVINSEVYFWINSIGGHIPVLSNVITGLSTIFGIYTRIINLKHSWITIINDNNGG